MPFLDNIAKQIVSTDVGFKVSKPGYDANRSLGSNLVFSSSWPSLPVAFSTTITNPITGGGLTSTVTHNLKFPPLTFIWAYGPDASGIGNSSMRMYMAQTDTTTLYLSDNGLSGVQTDKLYTATKLHIKCFQLDISKDLDYILAPGDTYKSPYDSNFGIKVVKPTKDINSRDLRDFALHSRCQSPLILAQKTQLTANPANPTTIQYNSKLKYASWVYGFVKHSNGRYQYAPYYAQAYPITTTNGILSNITYSGGDTGASLIILRDPMFAATQTTVQY